MSMESVANMAIVYVNVKSDEDRAFVKSRLIDEVHRHSGLIRFDLAEINIALSEMRSPALIGETKHLRDVIQGEADALDSFGRVIKEPKQ